MRRGWMVVVGGMLALLCLPAAARASQNDAAKVLETFAAGAFQYQLAVAPCVREECPVIVNLLKNGKRVDRKTLPQAAVEGHEFERALIRPAWSDMLFNAAPELRVWNSGYEDAYVGVLARAVPLDAARVGLLVTQLTGFDVLHRDHVLYVAEKGKLKEIWSFSDTSPPVSSAIYPVVHQGRNVLLFWKDHESYQEGYLEGRIVPHSHQASLLIWRAKKKTLESVTLPTKEIPLYAAVIGFYPGAAQARQAAEKIECPINLELLHPETVDHRPFVSIFTLVTADYPQLKNEGEAFLGNVFFTREEAQQYQEGLERCTPTTDSRIVPLN